MKKLTNDTYMIVDNDSLKVMRHVYHHPVYPVEQLTKKFGKNKPSDYIDFRIFLLAECEYGILSDADGNSKCSVSPKEVHNLYFSLLPPGNKYVEDHRFTIIQWIVPVIVSVLALITSVSALITSLNNEIIVHLMK